MRRTLFVAVLSLSVAFAAGWYFGPDGGGVVHAQEPQEFAVGQDWGSLRGSLGNRMLLFEDSNGAIRGGRCD